MAKLAGSSMVDRAKATGGSADAVEIQRWAEMP